MKQTYAGLSEKDRRTYAAIEAMKLPRGGKTYIANLFGCSRNTVSKGISDLETPPDLLTQGRIRKKGGGRKKAIETIENIDDIFLKVIDDHIAGDPMDEKVRWTNLSRNQIASKMKEEGIDISVTVVKQLLKKHGFVKRKAMKTKSIGATKNRNEQFEKIAELKEQYLDVGNPVISVDTKKEFIGGLYREGQTYNTGAIEVYDHDFPYLADGIAIPHAIYDLKMNKALINIGVSKDTSEFACDSLRLWWEQYGRREYPGCTSILMLADGGGSNSSRHYIFKEDLQKLVDEIGVEIRVAHYPPYTSKWNPVEHRVFPHVTRSLKGVIVKGYEFFKELIGKTTTRTGLKVETNIINKLYKTGRKYAKDFKENMRIVFDDYLGQWNYRAIPEAQQLRSPY